MNQSYSVIVPTRNRENELLRCLKSIERQTILPDEVLIIDSSDNPQEIQTLCASFKNISVKYIYTTDRSAARQRNLGITASKGEIIFFFDDDIELDEKYIEESLKIYNDRNLANVGGVQGRDLNVKESFLQGKKRLYFHRLFFLNRSDKYAKLLPSGNVAHLDYGAEEVIHNKIPIEVKCAPGGIVSYRREVLNEFKFDDKYDGYSHGEDIELSHRIAKKHKIYFNPDAKVYHNQPSDKKNWYRTEDFVKSNIKAHIYLFRKHLRHNPLNYFAILWSWLGSLIWSGIIHPNSVYFWGSVKAMKTEFLNIVKPIEQFVDNRRLFFGE